MQLVSCVLNGGESLHSFFDIIRLGESCKPEITFAGRSEARTGRADDVRFSEQTVEEIPGADAVRGFHPDIRRINPAVNIVAELFERFANHIGVRQIDIYGFSALLLAFGRVNSGCAGL